jgi:hypothetical protein
MQGDSNKPNSPDGAWNYMPEDNSDSGHFDSLDQGSSEAGSVPVQDEGVAWTASEFVAHDKSFFWYAILLLIGIAITMGMYAITQERFTTCVVALFVLLVGITAARKPRIIEYKLSGKGVYAGSRFYSYGKYKSFKILEEGPFVSLVFVPMKRMDMPFSIYLAPEVEEVAVKILSQRLPLEPGRLDIIDELMRQLRF